MNEWFEWNILNLINLPPQDLELTYKLTQTPQKIVFNFVRWMTIGPTGVCVAMERAMILIGLALVPSFHLAWVGGEPIKLGRDTGLIF